MSNRRKKKVTNAPTDRKDTAVTIRKDAHREARIACAKSGVPMIDFV